MSKRRARCLACGRNRKKGHEERIGTDKAYADCKTYEEDRETVLKAKKCENT